jgi:starch synthase (maltosyl-transferring)
MNRVILAATLGASYGIYGPAFELCEHRPKSPGSEEYLDSEKYEIRAWDIDQADSLREFIGVLNRIRREHPALQSDRWLRFHETENDELICYSKRTEDFRNVILVVVNLDPHHTQSGWLNLDLDELGVERDTAYQAHDLLSQARYLWRGPSNFVSLDPHSVPGHVFAVRRKTRTERDFDYYM